MAHDMDAVTSSYDVPPLKLAITKYHTAYFNIEVFSRLRLFEEMP